MSSSHAVEGQRWFALYALCLGVLMVALDTTAVTVSLPSIVSDLGLSGTSLTWLLNTYLVTFSGFLILGGRLGDLYGQRRVFLTGLCVFTLASLMCGLAQSSIALFAARAIQGLGGAAVTAVSLSLITHLFSDRAERARAMGIYGFICATGGCVGELIGGLVTQAFGWQWIFLINLPIGIAVCAFCAVTLPRNIPTSRGVRLDVGGAVTVTATLTLAVCALANIPEMGWSGFRTAGFLAIAVAVFFIFLGIEARVREPLIPLRLFQVRDFTAGSVLGVIWSAGGFPWFVLAALYLQRVLGYSPLQVGLAFIPTTALSAALSAGLTAKFVTRFGTRGPLLVGLLLGSISLILFARAPVGGTFVLDVFPGMVLLGIGNGLASTPLLLASMNRIESSVAGLASGIVNTTFMMGGTLGLAALGSLAQARTHLLEQSGTDALVALNGGYHAAFWVGALLTGTAALIAALAFSPGRLVHPPRSIVQT